MTRTKFLHRDHHAIYFVLATTAAAAGGCSRPAEANSQQNTSKAAKSAPDPDSAAAHASRSSPEKAEVTPELTRKAEQLLEQHADAPYGSEIPFRLNGRSYVARVEEHDNPSGEPGRPPGKHKGLTVYVAR